MVARHSRVGQDVRSEPPGEEVLWEELGLTLQVCEVGGCGGKRGVPVLTPRAGN